MGTVVTTNQTIKVVEDYDELRNAMAATQPLMELTEKRSGKEYPFLINKMHVVSVNK